MLEVAPAGAVGRREGQEDARRGQGSIFALGDGGGAEATAAAWRAPATRLVGEEFEQRELLAMEKETLGTFLSAHPLSEVRDALRGAGRLLADRARREGRTAPG